VRAVGNITVGRYTNPDCTGYAGWVEPDDRTWITYIGQDGTPVVFLDRDRVTGAVT
jgi:hypothetical protein